MVLVKRGEEVIEIPDCLCVRDAEGNRVVRPFGCPEHPGPSTGRVDPSWVLKQVA